MNSHTAVRSGLPSAGERVAELAGHALGSQRLGAGDAVWIDDERRGQAGDGGRAITRTGK